MSESKIVAPGGGGILLDGSVNTDRFSSNAGTEFKLEWWNRRLLWNVRHEPTEHRVVVEEVEQLRWDIHLKVAATLSLVILLGIGVFTAMPLIYSLMIAAVFLVVLFLLVKFEQQLAGDKNSVTQSVTVIDTILWSGILDELEEAQSQTAKAQKERFKAAVAEAQRRHKAAEKAAKAAGEDKPEYEPVDKDLYINTNHQYDNSSLLALMERSTSDKSLTRFEERLSDYCEEHPEYAESFGRGVIHCGCTVCDFNQSHGSVPAASGVLTADNRRRNLTGGTKGVMAKLRGAAGFDEEGRRTKDAERRKARKSAENARRTKERAEAKEKAQLRKKKLEENIKEVKSARAQGHDDVKEK